MKVLQPLTIFSAEYGTAQGLGVLGDSIRMCTCSFLHLSVHVGEFLESKVTDVMD